MSGITGGIAEPAAAPATPPSYPLYPMKRLTDYASCAGCAAKIPPLTISRMLESVPRPADPNLLVGTETHDDAGVYRLTDDIALVQTIDFFPPVVDDPYTYGRIAAANALSDVYAMGGEPKTVLNLVCYPDDQLADSDWLARILEGAGERCRAAGAVVVGGHSVRDAEIKFGMAVTGVVHPAKFLTNAGARPGDKLVLTKPLGTGFVLTTAKKSTCPPGVLEAACESMAMLNKGAKDAALAVGGVHATTDVTGFGLCGHGFEMADGSGVTLAIDLKNLPLLPGVVENGLTKFRTRASTSNAEYVAPHADYPADADPVVLEFAWDAQTSGGLLMSVAADRAERLVAECRRAGRSGRASWARCFRKARRRWCSDGDLRVRRLRGVLQVVPDLRVGRRRRARAARGGRGAVAGAVAPGRPVFHPALPAAVPRRLLFPRPGRPLYDLRDPAGRVPGVRGGQRAVSGGAGAARVARIGTRRSTSGRGKRNPVRPRLVRDPSRAPRRGR